MIDGFDGERYDEEDCSDEKLIEVLADTNRYYPADKSTGMEYGIGYWSHMRDQADTIERELDARAADAREEDRCEMRDDDDRLTP